MSVGFMFSPTPTIAPKVADSGQALHGHPPSALCTGAGPGSCSHPRALGPPQGSSLALGGNG